MVPFDPLLRSPHLQTIAGHLWKRPDATREFPIERRLYRTEPDVQVLVCSQRPRGEARGEIVMVHGLEGSGEAGYMRSLSAAALRAGFAAHRFHMRTCGGTEQLCQTLYHAGLTSDLLAVLREFREAGRAPAFLVGFSLGGNVVLKLAGEMGEAARPNTCGPCARSPRRSTWRRARAASGERDNRVYERAIRAHHARAAVRHRPLPGARFRGLRSVSNIDDRITAPSFGFGDAANYYRTQSAIGYLAGLRVPALLVQAKDDTFVPFEAYESAAVRSNPWIELVATEYGGHSGFIGREPHRFWSDAAIMEWIAGAAVKKPPLESSRSK